MKSALPNLLTLLNLFSGCVAVIFVFNNHLEWASWAVLIGMVFDFFDGLVARVLKVNGPIGKELDSLADMVTFGLVPGLIVFKLMEMALMTFSLDWPFLPFTAFLITLGAAFRLAKFNVLPSQNDFIGLPTPANAIVFIAFPLIIAYQGNDAMNTFILNPFTLLFLTFTSALLMNLPVRIMSFKMREKNLRDFSPQLILVVISIVFLVVLKFAALPLIVLTHVVISLFKTYPK